MLQTLELHRTMLQAGHEDASRFALQRCRPAYLLDFELIFRYSFQPLERPDWASELQYLFECRDTKFLIGPGTQLEIKRFMHAAEVMFGDDGATETPGPSAAPDYEIYGLDGETVRVGIFRLNDLMDLPNVLPYSDIVPNAEFDESALKEAEAALNSRRGQHSRVMSNHLDALNWVAITHMRERSEAAKAGIFPYLLTATKPLLEASSWTPNATPAISRQPIDAIYTEILFNAFPDPVSAANHTIYMAVQAASLEERLRQSPAYISPDDFAEELEWEQVMKERRVTDELRDQLNELAHFVSDSVVADTQRIYDNARLASVSAEQQRGMVLKALEESPRRLFDLIVEVNAVLNVGLDQAGLSDLWTTVLDMATHEHEHRVTYELFEKDANPESTQYLAAERYFASKKRRGRRSRRGSPQARHEQFVLRWPTAMDAETVIASFSRAYARHDVETVDLVVGTTTTVEHFGATLPITLKDLLDAVSGDEQTEQSGSHQLQWIRMGARVFDLYADIAPGDLTRQPVVGVFVDSLNADHLQDLYALTSARYLLPAWFHRALDTIGN